MAISINDCPISEVSWGKVIAGAAIAAGVVAVIAYCPSVTNEIGAGLHSVASLLGGVGEWIAKETGALVGALQDNARLAVGSAAGGGAMAALSIERNYVPLKHSGEPVKFAEKEAFSAAQMRMLHELEDAGHITALAAFARA